jgi:hypothetical protein
VTSYRRGADRLDWEKYHEYKDFSTGMLGRKLNSTHVPRELYDDIAHDAAVDAILNGTDLHTECKAAFTYANSHASRQARCEDFNTITPLHDDYVYERIPEYRLIAQGLPQEFVDKYLPPSCRTLIPLARTHSCNELAERTGMANTLVCSMIHYAKQRYEKHLRGTFCRVESPTYYRGIFADAPKKFLRAHCNRNQRLALRLLHTHTLEEIATLLGKKPDVCRVYLYNIKVRYDRFKRGGPLHHSSLCPIIPEPQCALVVRGIPQDFIDKYCSEYQRKLVATLRNNSTKSTMELLGKTYQAVECAAYRVQQKYEQYQAGAHIRQYKVKVPKIRVKKVKPAKQPHVYKYNKLVKSLPQDFIDKYCTKKQRIFIDLLHTHTVDESARILGMTQEAAFSMRTGIQLKYEKYAQGDSTLMQCGVRELDEQRCKTQETQDVARLCREGMTNGEIAEELKITPKRVGYIVYTFRRRP